jgi:hypothetical protein
MTDDVDFGFVLFMFGMGVVIFFFIVRWYFGRTHKTPTWKGGRGGGRGDKEREDQ